MKITTVLFDLDGTLLPMDIDRFSKAYFSGLIDSLSPLGLEKEKVYTALSEGIRAMTENNGKDTNENVFWKIFDSYFGAAAIDMLPIIDKYYRTEFETVRRSCGFNPLAAKAVAECKNAGLHTVLATNPFFPKIATEKRISWAGLSPNDFEFITTYENSSFCKPNVLYYTEIIEKLGCCANECLMVGNDTVEDTAAEKVGTNIFLITECIIDRGNAPVSNWKNGGFEEFIAYIKEISEIRNYGS